MLHLFDDIAISPVRHLKNDPRHFSCNFEQALSDFNNFGRNISQKLSNQKLVYLHVPLNTM